MSAPPGHGPRLAEVQASTDGSTWTVVAKVTLPDTAGPHLMIFPAVAARLMRLSTIDGYGTAGVQVSEFEVFRR